MNPILGLVLKKYAIYFYQLKIKHGVVKSFLSKMGMINTSKDW